MKKIILIAICIGLTACGQSLTVGGASSNPGVSYQTVSGTNVMPITVDGSLCNSSTMYMNEPCATVTICASAGSPCQSISNILVDTGSFGLRIFSSVVNSSVKSGLNQTGAGNVAECAHFGSGTTFGPVVTAYVQLASGEQTSTAIPIQLIDDLYPTESSKSVSAALCTGPSPTYLAPDDNPTSSQYNGILGIGLLNQDCGSNASTGCTVVNATPPPDYFSCTGVTCTSTTTIGCTSLWGSVGCGTNVALANQVSNPVFGFPTDNDGLVVLLPPLNTSGNQYANGYVVFGIGTGSNGNNSPTASVNVYPASTSPYFSSTVKIGLTGNTNYFKSFLDSGSNAYYLDPSIPIYPFPGCINAGTCTNFYTQSGLSTETVTINGISANFFVANSNTLFSTANYVFNDVGGGFSSNTVDLGIPFFYGRAVWLGLNGQSTSGTPIGSQTGPFWAY